MRPYLMTRGIPRDLDYAFVGASPADPWWSPGGRELVVLEEPAVLARSAKGSLGMLVSGLPSSRRDVLGTRIRHTLVVDALEADPALAGRLAATALDPAGRERLGKELDEMLPIGRVEAVLSGDADGSEVGGLLERLLTAPGWETKPDGKGADREGSWAAPLGDPGARAAFLARVAALAEGREGHAFVSHSLTSVTGAGRAAAELPGHTAILLADGEIGGVVELGKVPGAVAAPPRRSAPPRPVPIIAAGSLTLVIALAVLAILLL
ncbi:hypothetical protein ETD83_02400 [Actinomadura soli]|uniref:Uncharacterized protein n=1 Tax=Actinomadura soli TaxID=2508997 RepID=A0A5C4JJL8_9ACTN|nr:hypothetical protein [Actinomadura soli]TMR07010.1 hypothetical protein ETD83_02400 [Actinomadura soli]